MLSSLLSDSATNMSLLVMLAKATVILVAALGITLAMQRVSAGARHLVWLVALGALLLIPALTAWAPLPLRVLPAAQSTWSIVETPAPRSAGSTNDVSAVTDVPAVPAAAAAADVAPSVAARAWTSIKEMDALQLVIAAWLTVMLAVLASLAWAAFAVRRIVKEASALSSQAWLAPLWEVSDRLGLEEAPRLLRSNEAKMPFACGLFQPTIVLPAECESWSTERRTAVLLHELAHVRRHDLVGHTLARLVCAVYWFHPLAWTAAKQLRSESERACDDLALSCGTRATDYAEHLLEIVTSVRGDATPVVALAMARRKEFEGRMLAILDPELPHSSPSRGQSAALIGSLAIIALTVGAISPTARVALAAPANTLATSANTLATPANTLAPPANLQATPGASVEPNSRLLGPTRGDTATTAQFRTQMSTRIDRQTNNTVQTTTNVQSNTVVAVAPTATPQPLVTINAEAFGRAVASSTLSALQSVIGSAAKQQGNDDRPGLLAKILRTDTSVTIRQTAAWGLREFAGTPVATAALANAVQHDAEACVREMAAWALADGDDNDATVIAALSGALRSDINANVRRTAAWSLGRVGGNAAIPALTAALADDYPEVRQRALWAVGTIEPKQAPKEVLSKLRDKDARVRELAAWALYRIEDPGTAPALEAALRAETDKDVQIADLRALATLGERSVDAIRGLVESSDPRIRTMAVRALAGGQATGPWPWPWPEPRPFP